MRLTGVLSLVATIMTASACAPSDDHSRAGNIEVVRTIFSEVWSKGNIESIDELYAADFVGHFPGETFYGQEGIAGHVIAHRTAFPDWTEEIEDTIAEHDRVVVRFRSTGTNLGKFLNNAPTGNLVEISEVAIFKLKDGKVVEQWVYPDMLSMQHQLTGKGQKTAEADLPENFVKTYEDTWQLHDASRLATFFTEESDMIVGIQPIVVGRVAIETWWNLYFSHIDSGRLVSISIESKRILSPNIVLLNVHTTTGGTHSETNEVLESREARGTWVVTSASGDWKIAALRMHSPVGERRFKPGTDE